MIKRSDPEWHGTKEWLEQQIALAHRRLELAGEEAEHNVDRGRIAGWRQLIATVEPDYVPPTQTPAYFPISPSR